MTEAGKKLWRLLDLVAREEAHLTGVIGRLFEGADSDLTGDWLRGVIGTPEGIDRLESFVGKFARMQDTLINELVPAFLVATGERTGTALDNLNRAQKLGFVHNPEAWLGMRLLRNRLVHEYVEDVAELAAALDQARKLADELIATYVSIRRYAEDHLGEPPG